MASINAHVVRQSNSQSDSKTQPVMEIKFVQSVHNHSDALVFTSHTLQNVGCMPCSFKGGGNNMKQPSRQSLIVHTVTNLSKGQWLTLAVTKTATCTSSKSKERKLGPPNKSNVTMICSTCLSTHHRQCHHRHWQCHHHPTPLKSHPKVSEPSPPRTAKAK